MIKDINYCNNLQNILRNKIGSNAYETWFSNCNFELQNNSLVIKLNNNAELNWIKKNYNKDLQIIGKEFFNAESVSFIINGSKAQVISDKKIQNHKDAQLTSNISNNLHYKEFILDDSNKIALSTINYLMENLQTSVIHGKILHIFGNSSCGKTTLLQSIYAKIGKENAIFFSALEFVNLYSNATRQNNLDTFRKDILSKKIFIIDDIHLISSQKGTLLEIAKIINIFADSGKIIITSANVSALDICENLTGKIKHLSSCLSVKIEDATYDLKVKFAESLLKQNNLQNRIKIENIVKKNSNMRQIDAIISKLKVSIISNNFSLFEDFNLEEKEITEQHQKYITASLKYFDIPKDKLFTRGGGQSVSMARYAIIYLLRKNTNMTMQKIASLFNLKSHTNIVRALSMFDDNKNNLDILNIISKIEDSLK